MSEGHDDPYLVERLREAFVTDVRVNELGLEVSVVAGTAYVRGKVATPERRQAISDLVAEIAPGVAMRNEVSVIDATPRSASPEYFG